MKKTIIMAAIIGLVGGALDTLTDWRKVWCFLAGIGVFVVYLLVLSIIKTAVIMRKTKGSKTIDLDQYNNIIRHE